MDTLYEAIVRVYTNNTDIDDNENDEASAEDRILDGATLTNLVNSVDLASTFNTLSGIFNFIITNFDVVTALALVRYLENRAMYDPR